MTVTAVFSVSNLNYPSIHRKDDHEKKIHSKIYSCLRNIYKR